MAGGLKEEEEQDKRGSKKVIAKLELVAAYER